MAHQIGVDEFRQSFQSYLSGVFALSISLLAATWLSSTSSAISNRLNDRRLRRLTLESLRMLTADEKQFLHPFITNGQNTVHAPITDGVAGGLVAKCLIYRSSNIFQPVAAPFNLRPIARKLLTENPMLLGPARLITLQQRPNQAPSRVQV